MEGNQTGRQSNASRALVEQDMAPNAIAGSGSSSGRGRGRGRGSRSVTGWRGNQMRGVRGRSTTARCPVIRNASSPLEPDDHVGEFEFQSQSNELHTDNSDSRLTCEASGSTLGVISSSNDTKHLSKHRAYAEWFDIEQGCWVPVWILGRLESKSKEEISKCIVVRQEEDGVEGNDSFELQLSELFVHKELNRHQWWPSPGEIIHVSSAAFQKSTRANHTKPWTKPFTVSSSTSLGNTRHTSTKSNFNPHEGSGSVSWLPAEVSKISSGFVSCIFKGEKSRSDAMVHVSLCRSGEMKNFKASKKLKVIPFPSPEPEKAVSPVALEAHEDSTTPQMQQEKEDCSSQCTEGEVAAENLVRIDTDAPWEYIQRTLSKSEMLDFFPDEMQVLPEARDTTSNAKSIVEHCDPNSNASDIALHIEAVEFSKPTCTTFDDQRMHQYNLADMGRGKGRRVGGLRIGRGGAAVGKRVDSGPRVLQASSDAEHAGTLETVSVPLDIDKEIAQEVISKINDFFADQPEDLQVQFVHVTDVEECEGTPGTSEFLFKGRQEAVQIGLGALRSTVSSCLRLASLHSERSNVQKRIQEFEDNRVREEVIQIPSDFIPALIGKRGENIKKILESDDVILVKVARDGETFSSEPEHIDSDAQHANMDHQVSDSSDDQHRAHAGGANSLIQDSGAQSPKTTSTEVKLVARGRAGMQMLKESVIPVRFNLGLSADLLLYLAKDSSKVLHQIKAKCKPFSCSLLYGSHAAADIDECQGLLDHVYIPSWSAPFISAVGDCSTPRAEPAASLSGFGTYQSITKMNSMLSKVHNLLFAQKQLSNELVELGHSLREMGTLKMSGSDKQSSKTSIDSKKISSKNSSGSGESITSVDKNEFQPDWWNDADGCQNDGSAVLGEAKPGAWAKLNGQESSTSRRSAGRFMGQDFPSLDTASKSNRKPKYQNLDSVSVQRNSVAYHGARRQDRNGRKALDRDDDRQDNASNGKQGTRGDRSSWDDQSGASSPRFHANSRRIVEGQGGETMMTPVTLWDFVKRPSNPASSNEQ